MATLKDLLDSGMSRDEINALLSQGTVGTTGFDGSSFEQPTPQPDYRDARDLGAMSTGGGIPAQQQTMAQFFANPQPTQPVQQEQPRQFTVISDDGLQRLNERPGSVEQAQMNTIRNNTTGEVTNLPSSGQRRHDVYRDGPQVLKEFQNPDGTIERFVKKPTTDGFGRQSTVVIRETVTPDYLNPAKLKEMEFKKKTAELAQLQARPQGDPDIQKQLNLMSMYESIPDPKMKQAFGEKHGFAGKPLIEEKPMTAAQRAKFEEGFANDYQTVNQTVSTMGEIKGAIDNIRGSKGLDSREGLTGYISPILQGENARIAENRIQTLKGKVTQMGKAMASMAGAIGPMAVQEWKIVSDAVNAIDPTAGNFKEQLANIESQADGAINRIQEKYERQYVDRFEKYPQFKREGDGIKSPSSPPQKPANNPTDDAGYDAWKKSKGLK